MSEETILKFPYVKYLIQDPTTKRVIDEAFRPVIPVRLITGSASYRFEGLIDSGADNCTFPGEIAEALGHNLTKGKPRLFTGIGGSVIGYLHKTDIEIEGIRFGCDIYYSNAWNDMRFGLLGQSGFLSRFKALLDYENKIVTVTFNK